VSDLRLTAASLSASTCKVRRDGRRASQEHGRAGQPSAAETKGSMDDYLRGRMFGLAHGGGQSSVPEKSAGGGGGRGGAEKAAGVTRRRRQLPCRRDEK
jgi:hypothetical protein